MSERLNTPAKDVWAMNITDFLTYIAVLEQDNEKETVNNMSYEDQILTGQINDIASTEDLLKLNRNF